MSNPLFFEIGPMAEGQLEEFLDSQGYALGKVIEEPGQSRLRPVLLGDVPLGSLRFTRPQGNHVCVLVSIDQPEYQYLDKWFAEEIGRLGGKRITAR